MITLLLGVICRDENSVLGRSMTSGETSYCGDELDDSEGVRSSALAR